MSGYGKLVEDLKYELHELRNLRDSQPDGSAQHDHFQEQAQRKADELILLESNTDALCGLDNELVQSQRQVDRAHVESREQVHVWKLTTLVAATVGVAVIGASSLLGFVLPALLGVLGLVGAGASGYWWFRAEEQSVELCSWAAARQKAAAAERKEFARKVLPAGARP